MTKISFGAWVRKASSRPAILFGLAEIIRRDSDASCGDIKCMVPTAPLEGDRLTPRHVSFCKDASRRKASINTEVRSVAVDVPHPPSPTLSCLFYNTHSGSGTMPSTVSDASSSACSKRAQSRTTSPSSWTATDAMPATRA